MPSNVKKKILYEGGKIIANLKKETYLGKFRGGWEGGVDHHSSADFNWWDKGESKGGAVIRTGRKVTISKEGIAGKISREKRKELEGDGKKGGISVKVESRKSRYSSRP